LTASVLDTDIFSELTRGRNDRVAQRARDYLTRHGRLSMTVLSVAEVVEGHQHMRRSARIDEFLERIASMEILTLDTPSAVLAGRIAGDLGRAGTPIGDHDPLIAAIAIQHQRVLVTGNTVHYQRIQSLGYPLQLDDWRQPA
jgi:tRNA(fMet)-specific endonuclease VapC